MIGCFHRCFLRFGAPRFLLLFRLSLAPQVVQVECGSDNVKASEYSHHDLSYRLAGPLGVSGCTVSGFCPQAFQSFLKVNWDKSVLLSQQQTRFGVLELDFVSMRVSSISWNCDHYGSVFRWSWSGIFLLKEHFTGWLQLYPDRAACEILSAVDEIHEIWILKRVVTHANVDA